MSGVTLFHGEQQQFGDILRQNKMVMEAFTNEDVIPALKTADFEFSASAKLEFMRSHDCIGIQIADVFAGFVARYIQGAVWGGVAVDPGRMSIFSRLVTAGVRDRGTGDEYRGPGESDPLSRHSSASELFINICLE